jgi:flagellar hook assembly protein FlgD
MKKLHELTIGLIVALLALTACENETLDSNKHQMDDSDTSSNVYIVGKDFSWEEIDSRTSLRIEDGLAKFGWTPGDRVGILPNEGA